MFVIDILKKSNIVPQVCELDLGVPILWQDSPTWIAAKNTQLPQLPYLQSNSSQVGQICTLVSTLFCGLITRSAGRDTHASQSHSGPQSLRSHPESKQCEPLPLRQPYHHVSCLLLHGSRSLSPVPYLAFSAQLAFIPGLNMKSLQNILNKISNLLKPSWNTRWTDVNLGLNLSVSCGPMGDATPFRKASARLKILRCFID